jgi:hypothetical protein
MTHEFGQIIQLLSNIVVIFTIVFVWLQVRELSRQADKLDKTLKFSSYERMMQHHTESSVNFLLPNPELLRWFLQTRGIEPGDENQNKMKLYILVKIGVHEYAYLQHSEGTIGIEPWSGRRDVMKADFKLKEIREVWDAAKHFYAPSFRVFVDRECA